MGKRKGPCYFCGNKASSKEHIPPKQLFIKGQYDRITVPSCDVHNTDKGSVDDVVIKYLMSIVIDKIRSGKVSSQLMDLIEKNMGHIREHEKKYEHNSVLYPGSIQRGVSFRSLASGEDMFKWAAQMAVGLLCFVNNSHEQSINYSHIVVESNSFDTKNTSQYEPEEYFGKRQQLIDLENEHRKGTWYKGILRGPKKYPSEVFQWRMEFRENKMVVWIEILTYFIWWVHLEAPHDTINKYRNYLK